MKNKDKNKRTSAYDYTDPDRYLGNFNPDELDFVNHETECKNALNDAGFGFDYEVESVNSKSIRDLSIGDVVKVLLRDNMGGCSNFVGTVVKLYDNAFYVHLTLPSGSYPGYKFKSWGRYDIRNTGLFISISNTDVVDWILIAKAKIQTIDIYSQKQIVTTENGATVSNITKECPFQTYKVYSNSYVIMAEFKDHYALIDKNFDHFKGMSDSVLSKLACYRANLKYKLKIANDLGVSYEL